MERGSCQIWGEHQRKQSETFSEWSPELKQEGEEVKRRRKGSETKLRPNWCLVFDISNLSLERILAQIRKQTLNYFHAYWWKECIYRAQNRKIAQSDQGVKGEGSSVETEHKFESAWPHELIAEQSPKAKAISEAETKNRGKRRKRVKNPGSDLWPLPGGKVEVKKQVRSSNLILSKQMLK